METGNPVSIFCVKKIFSKKNYKTYILKKIIIFFQHNKKRNNVKIFFVYKGKNCEKINQKTNY